ncbi:hypothetical protein Tco_0523595 [Tanacetum coccineum]
MSTSNIHQQSLADAGSETRPPMLEKVQNKVDRETHFNKEVDQFVAEPGEALLSVYNRFAQLMNDLKRNGIIFPKFIVNTKFLKCLQPEWLKVKKLEKSHDPLVLVAHTGSSSRTTVTPPNSGSSEMITMGCYFIVYTHKSQKTTTKETFK